MSIYTDGTRYSKILDSLYAQVLQVIGVDDKEKKGKRGIRFDIKKLNHVVS